MIEVTHDTCRFFLEKRERGRAEALSGSLSVEMLVIMIGKRNIMPWLQVRPGKTVDINRKVDLDSQVIGKMKEGERWPFGGFADYFSSDSEVLIAVVAV